MSKRFRSEEDCECCAELRKHIKFLQKIIEDNARMSIDYCSICPAWQLRDDRTGEVVETGGGLEDEEELVECEHCLNLFCRNHTGTDDYCRMCNECKQQNK